MNAPLSFYQGSVFHERKRPRSHQFRYPVFFVRINMRTLAQQKSRVWFGIDCFRPLAFFQRDHGTRDGQPLLPWARQILADMGVDDPGGDVWLYTFPRVWGFVFKPVSFWHWHNNEGDLHVLLAEVNNTFGERHMYLLQDSAHDPITETSDLVCNKCFHVSPFCEAQGHYRFHTATHNDRYRMIIDYAEQPLPLAALGSVPSDPDNHEVLLHTAMTGKPLDFTGANALRLLLRQPFMTLGIVIRIHWQALQLWYKGVPFFRKPSPPSAEVSS